MTTTTRPPATATDSPPARAPRRRGRRVLVALGAVAAAAGVGWLVGWSPVLGVGSIRVVGPEWMESDRVAEAAAVELGTPLARVDVDAVRARVQALPRVADVEVRRGWPRELVIVVTPRTPVAVVPTGSGWTLVDATGRAYVDVAERPGGLPELSTSGDGTAEAVAVAAGLPADLRSRVTSIAATTRDTVTLTLRSGAEVTWGSAERAELKARVLTAMLPLQARAYDVSAPELPTSTGAQRPRGAPREPSGQPTGTASPRAAEPTAAVDPRETAEPTPPTTIPSAAAQR